MKHLRNFLALFLGTMLVAQAAKYFSDFVVDDGKVQFQHRASAPTATAGNSFIYVATNNRPYYLDASGSVFDLLLGGSATLNDLFDVDTTGASTNDVIKFNGTTWVALPDGGGVSAWAQGAAYLAGDVVHTGDRIYLAETNHTSSDFPTELANGDWTELSDDVNRLTVATDNALVLWNGTSGNTVKSSSVLVTNDNDMSGIEDLTITGSMTLDGSGMYLGDRLGTANTYLGVSAGSTSTAVSERNVGIGYQALLNTDGTNNVGIGYQALVGNTLGSGNVGLGSGANRSNLIGVNNMAIGLEALFNNTGSYNVGIGQGALYNNTSADNNVAIGRQSLVSNQTGTNNVAIGYEAGYSSTGSGNLYLGYQAGYNNTLSNHLFIDNSNTATPLIGGNFSTNTATIGGTLAVTSMVTAGGVVYSNGTSLANTSAGVAGRLMQWNGSSAPTEFNPTAGTVFFGGTNGVAATDSGFTYDSGSDTITVGGVNVDNISIDTNTISSTNANGHIVLDTNGTGEVQIPGRLAVSSTTVTSRPYPSMASGEITLATVANGDVVYNSSEGIAEFRYSGSWQLFGCRLEGSVRYGANSNCIWNQSATSPTAFSADADCLNPDIAGTIAAPATKVPGVVVDVKANSTYIFLVNGWFRMNNVTTQSTGRVQMYDGADGYDTQVVSAYRTDVPTFSSNNAMFQKHYSVATDDVTFQLRGYTVDAGNPIEIDGQSSDFKIMVLRCPKN